VLRISRRLELIGFQPANPSQLVHIGCQQGMISKLVFTDIQLDILMIWRVSEPEDALVGELELVLTFDYQNLSLIGISRSWQVQSLQ